MLLPIILIIVGGCSQPVARTGFDGQISIIPSVALFENNELPDDWVRQGTLGEDSVQATSALKVPALKVTSHSSAFVVARRTDASLLATPFLNWAWYMEPQGKGTHNVQIAIGLNPKTAKDSAETSVFDFSLKQALGTKLPDYQKVILLNWGNSALQRGTYYKPVARSGQPSTIRYTVRGGRENTRKWIIETVDLSRIYQYAWPNENQQNIQVSFIGFAASKGDESVSGYFSGLRLSR